MNKKLPFVHSIPIFLLILILQSCYSARIVSNKDVNYSKKLKRIYVIVNIPKNVDHFNDRLLTTLINKIKEKGVITDGFARNPLSLETEEDINKKIDQYDPEALMVIKQTYITYMNGGPGAGVFEITLIAKEAKKPIWKSTLNLQGPWRDNATINIMVSKLLTQMEQDQLI